jgi:hypothetical protein
MRPLVARLAFVVVAALLAACSGNQSAVPAANVPQNAGPAVAGAVSGGVLHASRPGNGPVFGAHAFSYHVFPTVAHRAPAGVTSNGTKVFYPADLHNYGGPLMKTAVQHNIYVNCKSQNQKCWGHPEKFQQDLTGSTFVGLLTPYTKAAKGAYTFGEGTPVTYQAPTNVYYDNDLFSILHVVASTIGKTGYGDVYHIFLPKGVDTCFDLTTECYSPDNPSTWYFCAYHGNVTFGDIGTVVFSVEPYQNVGGCRYSSLPSGMNALDNSTDSTLAHETFESITDPNPNTYKTLGWYNIPYNQEIADLCDAFPTTVKLAPGGKYYIQTMYSNKHHGCANGP